MASSCARFDNPMTSGDWRRKMALKLHPDKVQDTDRVHAEARFKQLTAAYSLLSDPAKRQKFDAGASCIQHLMKYWQRVHFSRGRTYPSQQGVSSTRLSDLEGLPASICIAALDKGVRVNSI